MSWRKRKYTKKCKILSRVCNLRYEITIWHLSFVAQTMFASDAVQLYIIWINTFEQAMRVACQNVTMRTCSENYRSWFYHVGVSVCVLHLLRSAMTKTTSKMFHFMPVEHNRNFERISAIDLTDFYFVCFLVPHFRSCPVSTLLTKILQSPFISA